MPEANTTKIKARLEREGWKKDGGTKHDKYKRPACRRSWFPAIRP